MMRNGFRPKIRLRIWTLQGLKDRPSSMVAERAAAAAAAHTGTADVDVGGRSSSSAGDDIIIEAEDVVGIRTARSLGHDYSKGPTVATATGSGAVKDEAADKGSGGQDIEAEQEMVMRAQLARLAASLQIQLEYEPLEAAAAAGDGDHDGIMSSDEVADPGVQLYLRGRWARSRMMSKRVEHAGSCGSGGGINTKKKKKRRRRRRRRRRSKKKEEEELRRRLVVVNRIFAAHDSGLLAMDVDVVSDAIIASVQPHVVILADPVHNIPHTTGTTLTVKASPGVSPPSCRRRCSLSASRRFWGIFRHFAGLSQSLEATLPPSSPVRLLLDDTLLKHLITCTIFSFLHHYTLLRLQHQQPLHHHHHHPPHHHPHHQLEQQLDLPAASNTTHRSNHASTGHTTLTSKTVQSQQLLDADDDHHHGNLDDDGTGTGAGGEGHGNADHVIDPAADHVNLIRPPASCSCCCSSSNTHSLYPPSLSYQPLPLSSFAIAQAKLLLRLHYPSEGYRLHHHEKDESINSNSLLLGWQQTPLFQVSAWQQQHPQHHHHHRISHAHLIQPPRECLYNISNPKPYPKNKAKQNKMSSFKT
jgi:hypothetical protein